VSNKSLVPGRRAISDLDSVWLVENLWQKRPKIVSVILFIKVTMVSSMITMLYWLIASGSSSLFLGTVLAGHFHLVNAGGKPVLCFAAPTKERGGRRGGFATKQAGGGFGGGSSRTKSKEGGIVVKVSHEAKKLLKKYGNNVDTASSDYFQTQMNQLVGDDGTVSLSNEELHAARLKVSRLGTGTVSYGSF
jgi:hypothetical protein